MDTMKCALCWSEEEVEYGPRSSPLGLLVLCRPCLCTLEGSGEVFEPYRRKFIKVDDMDNYEMKWGKHKGTKFADVPASYCYWYVNKKRDEKPSDAFHVWCLVSYDAQYQKWQQERSLTT